VRSYAERGSQEDHRGTDQRTAGVKAETAPSSQFRGRSLDKQVASADRIANILPQEGRGTSFSTQNDMLMKKITHAEDENFWSIKEKKYKAEIDTLSKKYKKENSELLERIDRMKRLIPKDKKSDYYQSGFK
jgi:hypothetical protein